MKLTTSVLENDKQIIDSILDELINYLQPKFVESINATKSELSEALIKALKNEPEYQSLKTGKLRYEFGIPDTDVVDNIIELWARNFYIESKPLKRKGSQIVGSVFIGMIKQNFEDVLSSSDAIVYDNISNIALPWLNWLLLEGGKILVRNYEVKMGPNPRSRTGMAVMTESNKNWRVPPEFSGTIQNNWPVRAVDGMEKQIKKIILTQLERYIK